jgi:hypothetical protein
MVVVQARQTTQPRGISSFESILGLLKNFTNSGSVNESTASRVLRYLHNPLAVYITCINYSYK